jgi:hypothetical protein
MKFVVYLETAWEACGGSNVLMQLVRELCKRGHDAKAYVKDPYTVAAMYSDVPRQVTLDGLDDDVIAIYPERILGNPLNAKRVVRWILYGSHDYYEKYQPDEIIYYYAPFAKDNFPKQTLFLAYFPPGMENKHLERTNVQCHVVKKGWLRPDIRAVITSGHPVPDERDAISIDLGYSADHAHLIEMFNTTKYFYCYDPCCFLVGLALLCGCIVIQYPLLGCTEEEWMHTVGFSKGFRGLAYGRENLARAEATIQDAHEDVMKLVQKSSDSIDAFIRDMETGTYTIEPCFPYKTSSVSLYSYFKH